MQNPKLSLETIKTLKFSSASALVQVNDLFFTVSDDQLSVEIFSERMDEASTFKTIFPGALPQEKKQRKALKPDLESLVEIPEHFRLPGHCSVNLLALPSGSTERRRRGAWVGLEHPSDFRTIEAVDVSELYIQLERELPELNIEGAVFADSTLKLFQRGNGSLCANAVIDLEASLFVDELYRAKKVTAASLRKITTVELPSVLGTPFSFTDACGDPRGNGLTWFLAAAEDTKSTYDDGAVAGSLLGCMDASNVILQTWPLDISQKPEGLCIAKKDPTYFFVVTDTDDPEIPSTLLKGSLPEVP